MDTFILDFLVSHHDHDHDHDHNPHQVPYPSIHMHLVTIPCTISTLRYQRPSPREPVCTPVSLHCPLNLLYSPPHHFRFHFSFSAPPPSLSPIFLRHFKLPRTFNDQFFCYDFPCIYYIREPCSRGIISACICINGRRSAVPLPVSNVSSCISSHSSYPHDTKIVFASWSDSES